MQADKFSEALRVFHSKVGPYQQDSVFKRSTLLSSSILQTIYKFVEIKAILVYIIHFCAYDTTPAITPQNLDVVRS